MPHDAADILDVFNTAGRKIDADAARRIAREIAAYGCPGRAAQALANDGAHAPLSELLAYRAALAELADPALCIARLRREAADFDARAGPIWAEAAEFAGRAAYRRLQGETDLAGDFERRVLAAERAAAELEARAFANRLEAAALEASAARRDVLVAALESLAA